LRLPDKRRLRVLVRVHRVTERDSDGVREERRDPFSFFRRKCLRKSVIEDEHDAVLVFRVHVRVKKRHPPACDHH
jgi:hypothetical protein